MLFINSLFFQTSGIMTKGKRESLTGIRHFKLFLAISTIFLLLNLTSLRNNANFADITP